jgi:hypothetical protein
MNAWLEILSPIMSVTEHAILLLLFVLGALIVWIFLRRIRVITRARGNPEEWVKRLAGAWDGQPLNAPAPEEDNAPARLVRTTSC